MEKQQKRIILEALETMFDLQLRSVRTMLNKEEVTTKVVQRRGRKRKSLIDLSLEILTEEQKPVHVDDLVEFLMDRYGRVTDRDSLSSALAKKAKQGTLVRRVSPATFDRLK